MRSDKLRRGPLVIAALVSAAALSSAGCHSYKPLSAPGAAVAQQVRVQFAQPRDVAGRVAAGTDTVFKGVSALEGQTLSVTPDTVEMTVTKVTDSFGDRPVTTSVAVKIHPDPSVAIDVLSLDANRTAALAGGTLYFGILLAVVALTAAVVAASGNGW